MVTVIAATKLMDVEIHADTVLYQVSVGHVSSADIGTGTLVVSVSTTAEIDGLVLLVHSPVTANTGGI